MNRSRFFSSGTFAKLSRTTRNTLHLYDNINLLPPTFRATNNYRYYSNTQLAIINLIHILQESGLSLDEIVNAGKSLIESVGTNFQHINYYCIQPSKVKILNRIP